MRLFNAMKSFNQVMVSLILLTISTLSWAQKTVITYIHTDHLGTPVMATHEDGSVKWKNDYQPFGQQVKSTPTDSNVGFTGHLKDKGIGLTYMKGRWYQPESGRFMALDPVWYTEKNPVMSFNRYLYVNNNPYKYVDPDGEFLNFVIGAVIGVVAEVVVQTVVQGKSFGDVDYGAVGTAGMIGALSGGVGGAAGKLAGNVGKAIWSPASAMKPGISKVVAGALKGAVSGSTGAAVHNAASQAVTTGSVDGNKVVKSAVLGAVTGGLGGGVVGKIQGNATQRITGNAKDNMMFTSASPPGASTGAAIGTGIGAASTITKAVCAQKDQC